MKPIIHLRTKILPRERKFQLLAIGIASAMLLSGLLFADTASWYGGEEKLNEYTASGEFFNPVGLTCASYDYSFGARLLITNLDNNKSVVVVVNDRGPNKKLGRAIDLTRKAFSRIADLEQGIIQVKIEVINEESLLSK